MHEIKELSKIVLHTLKTYILNFVLHTIPTMFT